MSVYEALLTPGGATLHTQPLPKELVGTTYMQTRRRFDKGIVCGFIRDEKLQLLPSDSESEVSRHCLFTAFYCCCYCRRCCCRKAADHPR